MCRRRAGHGAHWASDAVGDTDDREHCGDDDAEGAVHGALQAGAQATTFTSSQGLLRMIPESSPRCASTSERSVATHRSRSSAITPM
jgi:hypothetical protein